MPGLKLLELLCAILYAFYVFRALRTIGKCTSRHLFAYGGFESFFFSIPAYFENRVNSGGAGQLVRSLTYFTSENKLTREKSPKISEQN